MTKMRFIDVKNHVYDRDVLPLVVRLYGFWPMCRAGLTLQWALGSIEFGANW